ncbi:MAG: hypothetical protein ABUT20_38355 [Bacteroidota bacterium]
MEILDAKMDIIIKVLIGIEKEVQLFNAARNGKISINEPPDFVQVTFRGAEIYLIHKAFIDSGGTLHENYKSLLEKTASRLSNKVQKGFSAESLAKYSDKVDPETKDNVKRFLQKMMRNIDSYD